MSNINFEEDKREDLNSVNEAKSLSDQVIKLKKLEDEVEEKEKELKELKRHPLKYAKYGLSHDICNALSWWAYGLVLNL